MDDDEREGLRAEIARRREAERRSADRAARAEQDLLASRAILAAMIESLPFDFWARDRDGYCFRQNATTRANWGDLFFTGYALDAADADADDWVLDKPA